MKDKATCEYQVYHFLPIKCAQRVLDLNPWILSYVSEGTVKAKIGDKPIFFTSGDVQLHPLKAQDVFSSEECLPVDTQKVEVITLFIYPQFLKNLAHNFPEYGEVVAHIQSIDQLVRYDAMRASQIAEKLEAMSRLSAPERIPMALDTLCLL